MLPHTDNKENDEIWRSCCFACDPHAATFIAQLAFSLIAFCVSIAMIIIKDDNKSLWIGIISMIIGVYIPQPSFKKT
jgi:hypothetical protein